MHPGTDVAKNAKKFAGHPAWALNKDGLVSLKGRYIALYVVFFGLLIVGFIDPAQVVLSGSGFSNVFFLVYAFAGGFAALSFWILSVLFRVEGRFFVKLFTAVALSLMIYWSGLYIGFGTFPKLMTRVVSTPTEISLDVVAVTRYAPRGKLSRLFQKISDSDVSYRFTLEDQPRILPYISESSHGLTVMPQRVRLLKRESLVFAGYGNWFGLRVTNIKSIE